MRFIPVIWRFINYKKVSTISVTINLGDYNTIKVSQMAPTYQEARGLLLDNLFSLGHDNNNIQNIIKDFIHEVFGAIEYEK